VPRPAVHRAALHRAILIVDVEKFGDPARNDDHQLAVRAAMYKALKQSFAKAHIRWRRCVVEDRGDGAFVLIPQAVPKSRLVTRLPARLADSLERHNASCPAPEQIRLRMALHAGEVHQDARGFAGTSINRAFRLIEAPELKKALRDGPGAVALIVSDWFYDDVVRHYAEAEPSSFRQVHVAVKETQMEAWVRVVWSRQVQAQDTGAQDTGQPSPVVPSSSVPSPAVRYSLPPDTAAFTGRDEELIRIRTAAEAGGAGVVVIDGMPGVGKTALATHVAHLLRDRFPDRQLFIDLHAHTPGHDPVPPSASLARLLLAVGFDVRSLPEDLEDRTGLWRDRMTGQRVLLVLDNAASSEQVIPLLPGGDGSLVVVTSRRRLADLPGAIVPVPTEVLPQGPALEMFIRLAPRAATAPAETITELVRLAGYLPLAISLLARVYVRHPSWEPADMIRETEASLLTLTAEKDSVAAAFEMSYRYLNAGQQQFFCCLSLHPGATIDAYAAAALAGISLSDAARHLDALHEEALLSEVSHRRYGMHDLIRRYARDRAATDPAARRDLGLERELDYYQYTAATAEIRLARQARTQPAASAVGVRPAAAPDIPDRDRALWWARTERANLISCLDYASRTGQQARVVAFTAALAGLLRQDGPWTEAINRHAAAVRAARRLGDRLALANALDDLGIVQRLIGDYRDAVWSQDEALRIYRAVGDRLGQANALGHLGMVRSLTDDYPGATQALREALDLFRDLGDHEGQAETLLHLGAVLRLTRDHRGAIRAGEEALGIYRDLGNRQGQANALIYLGPARRRSGDYPGAARAQEEALRIHRDLGHRQGQANALCYLGAVRRETGDYPGAAQAQEEALGIYRDLGSKLGQANAISELGSVRRQTGDYQGAAQAQEEALSIYRDLDDRGGQAIALCELGAVRRQTGAYQAAARALERALEILHDLGDEAEALNEMGTLHRVRGELDQAEACHRRALKMACEVDSYWDEAHALAGLGRCALVAGRLEDALASLEEARDIFQRIGTAEAAGVTAEVDALSRAQAQTGPLGAGAPLG
jgi:tetratricopeptide (TPR) repeat protein